MKAESLLGLSDNLFCNIHNCGPSKSFCVGGNYNPFLIEEEWGCYDFEMQNLKPKCNLPFP